ncbi:hypothetical protein RRG08_016911, partial [Elysia crispata]
QKIGNVELFWPK